MINQIDYDLLQEEVIKLRIDLEEAKKHKNRGEKAYMSLLRDYNNQKEEIKRLKAGFRTFKELIISAEKLYK